MSPPYIKESEPTAEGNGRFRRTRHEAVKMLNVSDLGLLFFGGWELGDIHMRATGACPRPT